MKRFLLALALVSIHAHAEVPEIMAKNVTCAEIKAELVKYKSLTVVKSFMGIKKRLDVELKADCDYDENAEAAYFKTKDVKYCEVGEYCRVERSSYSSGSSYDSGYSSGSSYDSGWSSGSSSGSWSSGSSSSGSSSSGSSHGSSYNPPSSSSSGSNYNPPSSGTRGSRYCPTCAF